MVLCVDAGNSFVKYALATQGGWITLGRHTPKEAAAGRWPAAFRRHHKALASPEGVIVSSVVPALNRRLSERLRRQTGVRVVFVDCSWRFPFRLRVANPREVGIDRICAAAGAVRYGARSVIVVDVGSAITVDLVTRGEYRGGLIFSGPGLGLRALGEYAEQLPVLDQARLQERTPERFDGTRRSMLLGSRLAAAGAIKEAVAFLRRPLRDRTRQYITGGGGRPLLPHLPETWTFDPDLVQKGLYNVWRLNIESDD